MIPFNDINYSSNLKSDFGLTSSEVCDFLEYLESIFEVNFPSRKSPDHYEYLIDIIFFIIVFQFEENH